MRRTTDFYQQNSEADLFSTLDFSPSLPLFLSSPPHCSHCSVRKHTVVVTGKTLVFTARMAIVESSSTESQGFNYICAILFLLFQSANTTLVGTFLSWLNKVSLYKTLSTAPSVPSPQSTLICNRCPLLLKKSAVYSMHTHLILMILFFYPAAQICVARAPVETLKVAMNPFNAVTQRELKTKTKQKNKEQRMHLITTNPAY